MFDIKSVEKAAQEEIAKERGEAAKKKIKDHLRKVAAARAVVRNLEDEYQVLLQDIGTDA